jgi:recombination associated protein RdgC
MSAFELEHNRPMRRAESLQIKEDIEFDLLPKAFTMLKKDWLYIDTTKQWIVINGSNQNKASEIITQLTKALGSLAAAPLSIDADLNNLFSAWLRVPLSIPEGLSLKQNCVLINGKNDKSQYSCKDIEQNKEELIALLEQGYSVSSVELAWFDRIQFTLTDNFMLKRLKCIDYLDDAFKDNTKLEGVQEQFDANFSLLAGELRDLLTFLIGSCHKKDAASVVGSESPIYNAPSSTAFTSIV